MLQQEPLLEESTALHPQMTADTSQFGSPCKQRESCSHSAILMTEVFILQALLKDTKRKFFFFLNYPKKWIAIRSLGNLETH